MVELVQPHAYEQRVSTVWEEAPPWAPLPGKGRSTGTIRQYMYR